MKTIKLLGLPFLVFISIILVMPFQSCDPENDCDDEEKECDTCSIVYKPNIYIYPYETIDLSVSLDFPMGGKVVTSIPEYGTGWDVVVDTSGLIDNTYTFLFYESTQPDVWQRNYGWVIPLDELASFFTQNMTDYGFNEREINDFIEYWVPRLGDYPTYTVYPQTKRIIEEVIQLNFSEQPEYILRLFYVIKGHNQFQDNLDEPTIDRFERTGYFVTEWGVILD